jgi:hypothetical protein
MAKRKKTGKTIGDIINIAASTKSVHDFHDYHIMTNSELERIKKETGLEFNAKCRTICTDDVRHAMAKHANDSCPLTYEDILLVDYITQNYDFVEAGGVTDKTGLQTIKYTKIIVDKHIVVEEIRVGRSKLAFKTMYKNKIKKR